MNLEVQREGIATPVQVKLTRHYKSRKAVRSARQPSASPRPQDFQRSPRAIGISSPGSAEGTRPKMSTSPRVIQPGTFAPMFRQAKAMRDERRSVICQGAQEFQRPLRSDTPYGIGFAAGQPKFTVALHDSARFSRPETASSRVFTRRCVALPRAHSHQQSPRN